ncbi:MAG: molybdopterin molybdotransferase MoeA [Gemmatimonadales bacterium]
MTAPLTPAEAARRILAEVRVQPPLRLPLDDALGAVLAEPVTCPIDIPAWTNSAMDGFAARAEDVRGASLPNPRVLRVVETIPAGRFPTRAIGPGECARIFTGAPLPEGADSVIRQEDTDLGARGQGPGARGRAAEPPGEGRGDWVVSISNDRDCGVNIRRAGEDMHKGEVVLPAGTELGPAQLGVLASIAVAQPVVFRRPRVAILGSGDEIVDLDRPEEILSGRKVASSNTHTLLALIRQAGGIPVNLGIATDTPESLRDHLTRAAGCDLLVTTAGISVGEHDYLRSVLAELGAELRFWKLRMRPGAPVGFGLLGETPWIGLPGNPVSTMVTFELFVRPAIRRMMGHRLPFRRTIPVRVMEPIRLGPKLQHFLRAVVTETGGSSAGRLDGSALGARHSARGPWPPAPGPWPLEARLTGPQGSGILTSMVRANALLVIPEGQHETPPAAEASAILLDDLHHVAEPPW